MRPTWTETARAPRLGIAALALLLASACGSGPRRDDAAQATGPDAEVVAAYEAALGDMQAGRREQAERRLQALADQHPSYAGPLVNLALLHGQAGDLAGATALLERAVTVCERCAEPWTELGVVQRRQGRFAEAEQSYLRAIAADGGYANAYFNLAVLYELYLQRPAMALEQYERFRQLAAADAAGDVDKWVADLQRRTGAVQSAAQLEGSP